MVNCGGGEENEDKSLWVVEKKRTRELLSPETQILRDAH